MKPFVYRLHDDFQDVVHDLHAGHNSIGRSRTNQIVIRNGSLSSGRHAAVVIEEQRIYVLDYGSTNGVVLNGRRVEMSELSPGDIILLGNVSFTLLAEELLPQLPDELIVLPASGPAVERAWQAKGVGFDEEDDELWAALYLRWRDAQLASAPHFGDTVWPIRAAATMCSAPMLRYLRNALFREDRVQWFLFQDTTFIETLATADHGVGALFACDVALNHPNASCRVPAQDALRKAARDWDLDAGTYVLRRVPTKATSISDLVAQAFVFAQRERSSWSSAQFTRFMPRPSFAEAAEWIVFALRDADDELVATFRALEQDLITLDDTLELPTDHFVSVARLGDVDAQAQARWMEHLSDFEVVQPFAQFSG